MINVSGGVCEQEIAGGRMIYVSSIQTLNHELAWETKIFTHF